MIAKIHLNRNDVTQKISCGSKFANCRFCVGLAVFYPATRLASGLLLLCVIGAELPFVALKYLLVRRPFSSLSNAMGLLAEELGIWRNDVSSQRNVFVFIR